MINLEELQESQPVSEPIKTRPRVGNDKTILAIVGIVLLLATAGAGYMYFAGSAKNNVAVALVNGEEITRGMLNNHIKKVAAGMDLTTITEEERREIEEYTLDLMISEKLLLEEAKARGINASSQEVEAQIASIKSGYPGDAEFNQALKDANITEQELRKSIEQQNIFFQLANVSISEEEIVALYESEMKGEEGDPGYEAARPLLRQNIEQQKLSEAIPIILGEIRENADIQILL
ncbi:MAG: SurA N-terminal domain-containing protein [bacterium]|nr:SurA N-terminal domain-containing protein [bacterium]